ncbi:dihydrofolate reductase [Luteolibacter yonseiensis]|uniref:dihydrofolate reductase n=1 Tax=Luteolibacter yonseiensis TaxID=1144680 RepID=A0A934R5H7_9BACT|nr:dihydrofolate reductase [Luteolibacter yonseiensis]MBK1816752.1 dihydrofolate reductase [Luteolibacter yonseiensis]
MSIQLTAVVAMTGERVIGRAGTLPWHLPEDLAFFKRTTSGHPIVMGRKTYESIGRPLPKRRNIVMTRDQNWSAMGVEVIHSPADLAELPGLDGRVFVIGGSEIYSAFLPELDDLLVSHIFENHAGDTRLAEFETSFPVSELVETHPAFEVRRHSRGSATAEIRLASEIPPL